ncbi:MAG: 23S rRNA (uracil(1939)-C(5))-methyltransferase RlmD [Defluviitaleaceae bacterium]|nr:23S rRNA (uracil(1939)-C(5))-methyltransferase RlmD [Defluviitaleaceae bacterium]
MICEHFGRCGGCTYLDIPYEEELRIKRAALEECLGIHGKLLGKLHAAPSPEGYRNKMEFAFGDEGKDGLLALGIRKKRNYYEVATPLDCVLLPEDFKRIVRYALDFFRKTDETFFHRKRHTGALRHLVLRRGEYKGEILVTLSTSSTLKTSLEPFVHGLLALPTEGKIVGVLHAINDGVADAVKNENTICIYGRDFYTEKIAGLLFKVSAFSFFQTNTKAAEILYGIVKEFAGQARETALDLYCGTGTIAQIVSPHFKNVIGIELVEDAILAARENAKQNNITNCTFYAGDVFTVLERLNSPALDVIIADPPRDGLHPKALAKITSLGKSSSIIYVACKPKSLARDIPAFLDAGFSLVKIEAVDMFPRTPHIEAVALLNYSNP